MKNNVIAFHNSRKTDSRTCDDTPARSVRDNIVSIVEWTSRAHARRTPSGVFFTTRVLCTAGSIA